MLLWAAVRAGFSAVRRSKRIVLLTALSTTCIALPPAVYFAREVHALAARRPDATELARAFDPDFFAELRAGNPGLDGSMTALVVVSILLYFLVRPLVWGGSCGIAATPRRLPFATWVREGGATYWKFLRIGLIGAVLLFAVAIAEKPLLDLVDGWARGDAGEDVAKRYLWTGQVAALVGLQLVKLVLDYAKVGVRLHRRPGVLVELGRSAMFVLQHPLRTLSVFAVARAIELGCLALFAVLLPIADGAYVATTVVVVLLGTLLVALREAVSLFHIAAAWHVRADADAPPLPPPPPGSEEQDLLQAPLPWHEA